VSFLLDTNVISEVRKSRPHPGVARWYETVAGTDLYLSVLVVGEIQQGITRLRRRDRRQAATYETWLERLQASFADRLLPVTQEVALEWGRLNAGGPVPVVDGLLAATASVHRLTLVTRNVDDVARTGVALLNPFED
jgi:predicted nucleic acid-binding protein